MINFIFTLLLYPSRIYLTGCPGFSRRQNSAIKTSFYFSTFFGNKKNILGGSVVVVVEVVVEKNDVFWVIKIFGHAGVVKDLKVTSGLSSVVLFLIKTLVVVVFVVVVDFVVVVILNVDHWFSIV